MKNLQKPDESSAGIVVFGLGLVIASYLIVTLVLSMIFY
jgi:hypothetical protein